MGWGSAGPPPWVDEERQNEEEKAKKMAQYLARITALEKENETLKMRVKQLEDELNKTNK
jgi:predicted RNase H-like nuclease (RuvC/YqgF family)